MADPLSIQGINAAQSMTAANKTAAAGGAAAPDGASFESCLLDSLDQVNRLQQEANQGVENVVTGQTDNIAEVFSAVRKADVAFSMLMEMRNKLVDAYQQVQQMRV
jgi:flagellar hook-basal body complex protein FliE